MLTKYKYGEDTFVVNVKSKTLLSPSPRAKKLFNNGMLKLTRFDIG
jgi:hypothetical protein